MLVILDDLVLDVGKYEEQHPGGLFVLKHNIGQDISKFFHGGYSLEDNLGAKPAQGYQHSFFAFCIANDLAIARYEPDKVVTTTVCQVRPNLCKAINATRKTIVVENIKNNQ